MRPALIGDIGGTNARLALVTPGEVTPHDILNLPPSGCINVHASLLPRWRGAAPIHRAIEAGDSSTGVTLMLMDDGLDTGNILFQSLRLCQVCSYLHQKRRVFGRWVGQF